MKRFSFRCEDLAHWGHQPRRSCSSPLTRLRFVPSTHHIHHTTHEIEPHARGTGPSKIPPRRARPPLTKGG